MKPSTLSVLRGVIGITVDQMAKRLGCSRDMIKSIECNRQKLGEERAQKLFHQTQISLSWLLANDPTVPPVSGRGEPYTREIFERAQAEKHWFDQQHPFFRLNNAIGFCAQLFAILESANAQKKYYMAAYKTSEAIEALRKEFGQDLQVYPVTNPEVVTYGPALEIFRELMEHGQKLVDDGSLRLAAFRDAQKKQSSQRPQKKKKRA